MSVHEMTSKCINIDFRFNVPCTLFRQKGAQILCFRGNFYCSVNPNYFHIIHSFTDSLYEQNGAKIMQLEPEEDNRDGFSIRIIVEKMLERREKHKFLLVFSDGEPSAANYDDNGIIDTHLAVTEARKQGIDV